MASQSTSPAYPQSSFVTTVYSELCRSYQGLHDFRMKLLGLLPIASVVGLVVLGKVLPTPPSKSVSTPAPTSTSTSASPSTPASTPASGEQDLPAEVVGYIGIFSGIFTLALFGYEVRSLLMCHDYSVTGARLETAMGIHGQFTRCNETRHFACYQGRIKRPLARLVNDQVTSSLVYSFVFSSWFFVGLKFAFGLVTHQCVWIAVGMGVATVTAALLFLRAVTRESEPRGLTDTDEAFFWTGRRIVLRGSWRRDSR